MEKMVKNEDRWSCLCAYDGTDFSGWQSQADGNAIQDFIERRLGEIFSRKVRIHGAGRTDSGVHARGQVFHFDAFWPHDASKLLAALRYGMPPAIAIRKICRVEQNFHARFSARAKRYIYRIKLGAADPFCFRWRWHIHRNIFDKEAMARAAVAFMGTHSFGAFANQRGNDEPQKSLRSIHRSQIKVRGNDIIYLTEGNGYLYKMVRRMVGAMVEVASGRRTVQHIVEALANGVSFPSFPSAPASGLTLERVFY